MKIDQVKTSYYFGFPKIIVMLLIHTALEKYDSQALIKIETQRFLMIGILNSIAISRSL